MRIFLYVPFCLLLLVQGAIAQDCTTGFRILGWPHVQAPSGAVKMADFEGGQVVLTQDDVSDAQPGFDDINQPTVFMRFTPDGREKLHLYTLDHVHLPIALVYGNELLSAPMVMEPVSGGAAQISGLQSTQEAHDMALNINSGICPPDAGS